MLWESSELKQFTVRATDGEIGTFEDFLFDDRSWEIRWAVVSTGSWFAREKVLLPPTALATPELDRHEFPVKLTREQVKNSPDLAADARVSRQVEQDIYAHYGWAPYWTAGAIPPLATGVPEFGTGDPAGPEPLGKDEARDPDLRSTGGVTGYYLEARDGDIGHVETFLVEEGSWVIRYLVIDTKNWWPGRKVVISPQWISAVDWSVQKIRIELGRELIKASPEYEASTPVERAYEDQLFRHYGYKPYWQ